MNLIKQNVLIVDDAGNLMKESGNLLKQVYVLTEDELKEVSGINESVKVIMKIKGFLNLHKEQFVEFLNKELQEQLNSKAMPTLKEIGDSYGKIKAIAFAKWINKNGYREYDESDKWISQSVTGNKVFTTEELYNIFSDEKHK